MPELNIKISDAVFISGERIILELLTNEDYAELINLCEINLENDYIKSLYAQKPEFVDLGLIEYFISCKIVRNNKCDMSENNFDGLYYVVKLKNGKIIGALEMYDFTEGIEFGLFIDRNHSCQHYGTEVLNTIIDFIKKNSSIRKFKWDCNTDNKGSIAVAKKCGFVHRNNWMIYEGRIISTFFLELKN